MAKQDNSSSVADHIASVVSAIDHPVEPRLRKVPGVVDETGLAIVRRAVLLRLATLGELEPESQESTGRAIVAICRTYLTNESARLNQDRQNGRTAP